ncbi:DUF2637 domain-containing protein [Nonomuraea sp. 3-1Str]|uniref:DUF2637 domain-containing protein n=1 Tax=Nonomuraea sp. 3-1Str TaxID=2929801 RepID=UPI0028565264|nr:DUF2637 domain-containing protein [Nonomuraea sp. 3-1Str]MDR8407184.1 DUF2637 domain-containing protein [Nonomuraea sp. 3-1Str]
MDVTPPSTLRRLGIALAGVAVAALTGAACALSFDDLRSLALRGEARADLAYLYPAAFDAVLAVALISLLLLRSARLLVRIQTAIVLVVLLVAAAATNVATALRLEPDARQAAVGVAVAPWVMLAVALWLWLLLIKHVQGRHSARDGDRADDGEQGGDTDLVPFPRGRAADTPPPLSETPPLTEPVQQVLEPTPVVGPTPAPETPPISERVTSWPTPDPAASDRPGDAGRSERAEEEAAESPHEAAESPHEAVAPRESAVPSREAAPREDTATGEQAVSREESVPPQDLAPREEAVAHAVSQEEDTPQQEAPPEEAAPEEAAPLEEAPRRPVRWGDRVRPTDVLVHPRTPAGKDADTQPVQVFSDDSAPARSRSTAAPETAAPQHASRAAARNAVPNNAPEADPGDAHDPQDLQNASHGDPDARRGISGERDESMVDTAPHPVVHEEPAAAYDAPAGRMRSTPLPPEDSDTKEAPQSP